MHIIICCNRFPALSQPFVTSEIVGLERRGHRVTVIAESIDQCHLAKLPPGSLLGPVLDLDMKGAHPLSTTYSRLHLMVTALAGMPGILRRPADAACYLRPQLRWRGAMAARAYARAAALREVDLVHAHMGETALWARSIAIRHQVPFVVTFHGSDATRDPREFGWSSYRQLLDPHMTTFIAHSPFVAKLLRSGLGVTPLRVPLGIDTSLFAPPKRPRDRGEETLRPRLAFVGRLIPMKGVRVAIETLAILRSAAPGMKLDATLDIVGEGPESSRIDIVTKALGVTSSVRLRGPMTPAGVAEAMREVDILLVPSLNDVDGREEAYGLVCLEAHASGVPVVGTYCGGLPGAVGAPEGGRCVPQHSPLAMAGAVRELVALATVEDLESPLRNRILESHGEDAYLAGYERAFAVARSRGLETGSRAAPTGADDWAGPRRPAPPVEPVQGSLPAYVIGREVLQIIRKPGPSAPFDRDMAAAWTVVRREGSGAVAGSMPGRADVVLDLDGVGLEALRAEARSLTGILRPGGLGIIAVHAREAAAAKTEQVTEGIGLGEIARLDRLFVPGSGGFEQPSTLDGPTAARRGGPILEYFLFVRS